MKKAKNSNLPQIIAFVTVALVRLYIYFFGSTSIMQYFDSTSYLNAEDRLFLGKTDIFRTPVYPLILDVFFPNLNNYAYSSIFLSIFQCLVSFAGVVAFYAILRKLNIKNSICCIFTVIFGICAPSYCYDQLILTESLSISFMLFLILMIVSYLKAPGVKKAIALSAFSLFMVLLRPAFVYLLAVEAVFFIFRFFHKSENKKNVVAGLLSVIVSASLLMGYCALNLSNNGIFCISYVSTNLNDFSIIVDNNLYKTNNNAFESIEEDIINMKNDNETSLIIPIKINEKYQPKMVNDYVKYIKKNNSSRFIKAKTDSACAELVTNLYKSQEQYYKHADYRDGFSKFLQNAPSVYCGFSVCSYLILCVMSLIAILIELITKKRLNYAVSGVMSILLCHTIITLAGGVGDNGRLMVPVFSTAFILVALACDYVVKLIISNSKTKQKSQNNL